jgi:hypothetical protein
MAPVATLAAGRRRLKLEPPASHAVRSGNMDERGIPEWIGTGIVPPPGLCRAFLPALHPSLALFEERQAKAISVIQFNLYRL